MPATRPTLYELLEIVRVENNAAHEKLSDRISSLERFDFARRRVGRLVNAVATLIIAALGALAGMKWGGS